MLETERLAAQASGQSVATAYVVSHASGYYAYAIKAVAENFPNPEEVEKMERLWRIERMAKYVKDDGSKENSA